MADFSVQATELSAPQGAGARVVAPVEERAVNTFPGKMIGELGDIFAKGLIADRKAKAEEAENLAVGNFVRDQTRLNDAVASGQMKPEQAAARSRANFSKYAAAYPQYIKGFSTANQALVGNSELGDVEEKVKSDREIRKADIKQAQDAGYTFLPGMSETQVDSQIQANKAALRAKNELEAMYKRNAEMRAQGAEDRLLSDRTAKDTSVRLLNDIGGTQLQAFSDFGTALGQQVRSGKLHPDEASAQLATRFATIQAVLQSSAGVNPELAAPYRSLFNEMNEVAKTFFDPTKPAKEVEEKVKLIINQAKLIGLSDPKLAGAVAVSQMLGQNAEVALKISAPAMDAITRISNTPFDFNSKEFKPQIVSNPQVEPEVLSTLKAAVNKFVGPGAADNKKGKQELGNTVNEVLKQAGDMLSKGVDAQSLSGTAAFFASPEYAKMVTSGLVDKQAAQTARQTFQQLYEPQIVNGVQQKLDEYVYSRAGRRDEPKLTSEVVEITFGDAGIKFRPKNVKGLDPVEMRSQAAAVQEFNKMEKGINQLIHIGAHLEGRTDYAQYWEEHKHEFMPQLYSKYQNLNIGDIKKSGGESYRYKGGDATKQSSWEKVNGGGN